MRFLWGLMLVACGGKAASTTPEPLVQSTTPDAAPAPIVIEVPVATSSICSRTPRAIAKDQDGPGLVVVDATTAYWTNQNGGQVMAAPLEGGGAPRVLAEKQHPYAIAIDATHVYWAKNLSRQTGSVMRVPKTGGPAQTIADKQGTPYGLTIVGDSLYWVNAEDGTIMRAALDGKNRKVLASGQMQPTALASDGRSLFWIHTKAGSEIRKVSLDGGAPATVATVSMGNPQVVVADRTRVYWANQHRGTIEAASVDGGAPADVIIDEHYPIDLAIDDTNAYWVDHDRPDRRPAPPKRIRKGPLQGGDGVTLATAPDALGITVDASCVYWTEARGTTGAVMTVAK